MKKERPATPETENPAASLSPEGVEVLKRYSACLISSSEAMDLLGLQYHGELLDLLGMTNLPFPSLPEERIAEMLREMNQVL